MIGAVLNALNRIYSGILKLSSFTNYTANAHIFGRGTLDITITSSTNARDLYNQYGTLEFRNVTINDGVSLRPYAEWGGHDNCVSQPTDFHPLYLKCSGTLTVNGQLTASECGGKTRYYTKDYRELTQDKITAPVDLYNVNKFGDGFSADPRNLIRLMEYGKNGGFFKFANLFLVGAGGGGKYEWKSGQGSHKSKDFHMLGFANGGYYNGNTNTFMGAAGGFVGLYFSHLYINGIEYGKPGCDVTKVSANGYYVSGEDWHGGGCLVVAARNIRIGPNGSINADAQGYSSYTVHYKNTGKVYDRGYGGNQGIRPSFLNNFPALQGGQTGYAWDESSQKYIEKTGESTYYFDDGSGGGIPNAYVSNVNTNLGCGGAGICIGYKIPDDMNITPESTTTQVTYFGWLGYRVPYYAWVYNNVVAYTDTESPTSESFTVGTQPSGYQYKITGSGDNYIILTTTSGEQHTFTRSVTHDSGITPYIIYTKYIDPAVGLALYDTPNNIVTGYVSDFTKDPNCISDGVRWFTRSSSSDQSVVE